MNKISLYILFLFALNTIQAQIHELGLLFGGNNYIGDIGPTTYIAPNKLALGVLYKWNKSKRHSYRISYMHAKIASNDAASDMTYRKLRDYRFENTIDELSMGIEFNFFNFNLHETGFMMTPYIHTGINYFFYRNLYFLDGKMRKRDTANNLSIPITLGVKTRITNNFILGLESGVRYTFTNNLDGSYPPNTIGNHLRFGNTNTNDWYVFTGFTLTYTFGEKPCYCRN